MATKKEQAQADNKIVLVQTETGIEESFDVEHAERILNYDVNIAKTNWALVDKTLTFKDGKIITGSGNKTDSSASE